MTEPIRKLVELAAAAREHAHAPYSGFRVGAAVQGDDGRLYAGTNVENASYGLTVCAERVAVFSAIAAGCRRIRALAIVAAGPELPYPCGACRQVVAEFADAASEIYIATDDNLENIEITTLGALLPHAFEFWKTQ